MSRLILGCGNFGGVGSAPLQLLGLAEPPTAIHDNMAAGVMRAARERGVVMPDDLSVIGFDDSVIAPIVTSSLTTVRQPLAELGRTAVSLLIRMLENLRVEALRIELATRLVVRESTGLRGDDRCVSGIQPLRCGLPSSLSRDSRGIRLCFGESELRLSQSIGPLLYGLGFRTARSALIADTG